MKMIPSSVVANRLASILNLICDDIYKQSLIIAKHMVEGNKYDIDFIIRVYENHIHELALLISAVLESKELLSAIFQIADPLLLFSFNIVAQNSVEFLKRNNASYQTYESDKDFFIHFALFTISKSEKAI
jgi:hypothetical protein